MGKCYSTTSDIVQKATQGMETVVGYVKSDVNRRYHPVSQEDTTIVIDEKEIKDIFDNVSDDYI